MTATSIAQFDIDDVADLVDGAKMATTTGDEGLAISMVDVVIAIIVNP